MKPTTRRRSRGSAWYWKQTDSWYFTKPGTQRRVRLKGPDGMPIRGQERRSDAELALARIRVKHSKEVNEASFFAEALVVARVCSDYVVECERREGQAGISLEYLQEVRRYLNAFAAYCGQVSVAEIKKAHLEQWLTQQASWRSPATQRSAIGAVLSAFRHAEQTSQVPNRLKGFPKPPQRPRLHSLSPQEEAALYAEADPSFREFLFAAINTGLRPFCELARLTPGMVIESAQGMLWKVYSSKTDKTRVIPVRREVAERTRRLLQTAGSQPVFRNRQGKAWKKPTAGKRFREIRHSLGWDSDPLKSKYSCYSCRHTFAHRMLSGYWNGGIGCSIEVLAEMLGDTPKVAFDHYGREWGQHYQDPLWAAIGVGSQTSS